MVTATDPPPSGAYWADGGIVAAGAAAVSPVDHAIIVGDGVFETLKVIDGMPEDTVAPNVIISGLMRRMNKRIYQCDVPHQSRVEGSAGLVRLRLFRLATRCFVQTVAAAMRR